MAKHNIFGQEGEKAACECLLKKGYIIRERNWRCGKNEVDIIAEHDNRIIVVEVKTRSSPVEDLSRIIDTKKIRHLVNAGKAYIERFRLPHELQFDVILLTGDEQHFSIEHIEDAIIPPMLTYH